MIRKIARFTRISLAALALMGLLSLTLLALFGEKVLRSQVEKRLQLALGRPVTVGALSVNLPARVVEIRDLLIPGLPQSKRPSLVAPRARLALSFRSLFTTRILLRGLELERPRFSVQVFPDGTTDLPQPIASASAPSTTRVSIGQLTVKAGDLFLNEERIPLEMVLPDFEASLAPEGRNLLKGDLHAGPGPMRFGDLPSENAKLDFGIRYADSTLFVDRGSLTSAATRLSIIGSIDLRQAAKGSFRLTGPFDLESFDRSVIGTRLALKGVAESRGTLSFGEGKVALSGSLRGERASYDTIPVSAFSTNFTWDGDNVRFKDLLLEALGGKAALDVQLPEEAPIKVAGRIDGMAAEPLLRWLFDYRSAGLGSRVSGPIDLTIPRSDARLFSGTAQLAFAPEPTFGEPLSGTFPFSATQGVVTIANAKLDVPRTSLTLNGVVQPDKRLNLGVKLTSEDLVASDTLGTRLRVAFGAAEAKPLGVSGRGVFDGRAGGTISDPLFTGHFLGSNVSYLGVAWGEVDWTGTASGFEARTERLLASRGPSRIDLRGTQRLGATGVDDGLDLTVAIRDWPAKELLHLVESDLDIDTTVSGTLRLAGTRAKPLGEAVLTSSTGTANDVAYKGADLKLKFEGEALRIESLTATLAGGPVSVKGVLTEVNGQNAFDGEIELSEVELADLDLQDEDGPLIGGHISGRAVLSGPIERPRVTAHLESKRVFYGDEGVGAMTVDVNGSGDGVLQVSAKSDSPRFSASVSGTIEAKKPHQSRLEISLTSARIDPVLRALGSRFENAVAITASANAQVQGPLLEPDALTARIREGRLRIAVPEYALETAPGFVIDVERREVRIAGLTLTGEGTSLSVSGKVALKPGEQNDLSVTGRADLRAFSGFLREWRFRGAATLRSQIGGTLKSPRISGGLDIEDGSVRLRTFPQGLDDLNGRVIFNESQARVAGLEGRFGGGRVSVSGQMGFGGGSPSSFDFNFTGDSLGLRYPEGLRSTFGASLRLQGTTESHWLTGNLLVAKASWTRKYAITSELLGSESTSGGFLRTNLTLKPSPMHLDIAIRAPGTLRLDNNLASLSAKADLTLTGSPTEPQLLGRVEVERGKVYFRGNTYEVRKGVAQFSNPREINPVFDIEADTRLRSYRLTLQANGTFDRVSTRITSDPPLSGPQIASLLTGGDENSVADLAGSNTDLKTLGTGGANTLASSWVDDNLTGKVAQGFGLSRLSIDPGKGFLGRTGSRLTVGKRVARDLEVVYSRTIWGGIENQLVTAEYSLTNRFSLVASWAEPGGFGADVRTRFVLGKK